jgi:hypothetical protein
MTDRTETAEYQLLQKLKAYVQTIRPGPDISEKRAELATRRAVRYARIAALKPKQKP